MSSENDKSFTEKVEEGAEKAADKVEAFAENVGEEVKEGAQKAEEGGKNALDEIEDVSRKAVDAIGGFLGKAGAAIQSAAEDFTKKDLNKDGTIGRNDKPEEEKK